MFQYRVRHSSIRNMLSELDFPQDAPPAGSAVLEIAPGIFWGRQRLASRLDHVNFWLAADSGATAIVDTGAANADARAWWTEALRSFPAVSRVIVTHHHYDHIGMAGGGFCPAPKEGWGAPNEWAPPPGGARARG